MMHTAQADNTAPNSKIYNAKSITLPNAMQVVVVENARTPAVTHMVWYRLGGADEPIGHSGLAHYLEHLMFKGTELVPSGDFSKKVKSWGGNDNAFTSWDFTAYFQTVPKDKLESVMIMESDRMRNLNFDDENALTERDVIIQERRQRTDSNPAAQLSETMRANLFINHPYARPIIGWDDELQKLTPEGAREFYKKYYAPKNAILVVSGDVKAEDVFQRAASLYGSIENKGTKTRPSWPKVADVYGQATITHRHSDIKQPLWRRLYRVPSMGKNYEEALALTVAESIIGGNTGHLYNTLVVDQKIASAVSLYYSGISVDDATLSIGMTPMDETSLSDIESALNTVLNQIATHGVSEQDVSQAIAKLQDQAVYERDSLTGPAMMLGYQLACGLDLDQAEKWVYDLEHVSPEDVQMIVKKYLIPSSDHYHAVTGHLLPEES